MTAAELLEEVKATEELERLGWWKETCERCNGSGLNDVVRSGSICCFCSGYGFEWRKPKVKESK